MHGEVGQSVALGARNDLNHLDVFVKHAGFPLYDVASEETIGYDRRPDRHFAGPSGAPVLRQGAQPLVIGDQVTMEQELAKADRF